MTQIYFNIPSSVSVELIIQFSSQEFNIPETNFQVVKDYIEYCLSEGFNETKIIIEHFKSSGEFDAFIEIYTGNKTYNYFDNIITFLKKLSHKVKQPILIGDEYIDPYTFILIEPNKYCSTIEIDFDKYDNWRLRKSILHNI